MKTINKLGLGDLIREIALRQNIGATELADKIHCTRTNVYNIFERNSIDIDLLCKISKALNYNFLRVYYEDVENGIDKDTTLDFRTTGSYITKCPIPDYKAKYSIDEEIDRYYNILLEL